MLSFQQDGVCFNFRVAGAARRGDEVLLQTDVKDDFWVLPGGRVEMGETCENALKREIHEELGADTEVLRLLWVVENFFVYGGRDYHELGLFFLMQLGEQSPPMSARSRFSGREAGSGIQFDWFNRSEIERVKLVPDFLQAGLWQLPETPVHLVQPY